MNSDAFKDRLKQVIGSESNRNFAERCRISEGTVRRYLKGEAFPPLDTLEKIAEIGRCRLAWLASGEGPIEPGGTSGEVSAAVVDEKSADRSPIKRAAVSYIDDMTDSEAADIVKVILDRMDSPFAGLSPEDKARLKAVLAEKIREERERLNLCPSGAEDDLRRTGS